MKKKILLSGSGGFIGSNFLRGALYQKSNYTFVSVDWCKSPNVLNNIYSNKGHDFYIADIADKHVMDVIFQVERPDIVIHMAAQSFVDHSIEDAGAFVHSNVLGTQVLIDLSLKYKIEKFVQVSTDEVYGQLTSDTDKAWTEESPLAPRNPYSATKASSELMVMAAHQTHGLQYNITRCCNNYGPRQNTRNFIPKTIKKLMNDECMTVYDKGLQSREWLHCEDHISAIMTILEKGQDNEVYNISSGHEFNNLETFNEICNSVEKQTGKKLHNNIEFVPNGRIGHDYRYAVNSNKLRALGWKPSIKFKTGIYQTVEWYLKNNWFLKG